mmetsp:Transcript_71669/g.167839  ORF Transcript_71669/g.167839 Transcript_71669/m.167839 type:complete len:157 (-) Transcript_71669:450-920(-)
MRETMAWFQACDDAAFIWRVTLDPVRPVSRATAKVARHILRCFLSNPSWWQSATAPTLRCRNLMKEVHVPEAFDNKLGHVLGLLVRCSSKSINIHEAPGKGQRAQTPADFIRGTRRVHLGEFDRKECNLRPILSILVYILELLIGFISCPSPFPIC